MNSDETVSEPPISCPFTSVKKVQTIAIGSGKTQDYLEITVAPGPLSPLSDLAMNVTFSYSVSVLDVNVSKIELLKILI
jgi:hypothetical protein